jgi:tyrosine-protein phosphatase SIW14
MKASESLRYFSILSFAVLSSSLWAAGVHVSGVPHFQQVNERISRGGQPTEEGIKNLAKMGVKTVVDLRREGEDGEHSTRDERKVVEAAGMRYVHVPMKGFVAPTDAQIAKILAIFDSPEKVFVHCKKGKDRTGTVVACYRIARDGWNNKKALDEAKFYGIHWFELGMKSYINSFRGMAAQQVADAAPQNGTAPPVPTPAAEQPAAAKGATAQ